MLRKLLLFTSIISLVCLISAQCQRDFLQPINRSSVYDPKSTNYDPNKCLAFTISLDKTKYKIGEEINAKVKLTNNGGKNINVSAFYNCKSISFKLTTPEGISVFQGGNPMIISWWPSAIELGSGNSIENLFKISPLGEREPELRWINPTQKIDYYKLNTFGKYHLTASYHSMKGISDTTNTEIWRGDLSSDIDFEIIP